jgi:hypothetical protein
MIQYTVDERAYYWDSSNIVFKYFLIFTFHTSVKEKTTDILWQYKYIKRHMHKNCDVMVWPEFSLLDEERVRETGFFKELSIWVVAELKQYDTEIWVQQKHMSGHQVEAKIVIQVKK